MLVVVEEEEKLREGGSGLLTFLGLLTVKKALKNIFLGFCWWQEGDGHEEEEDDEYEMILFRNGSFIFFPIFLYFVWLLRK